MISPDIHILVNGNRCKLYYHEGKTYIEAKQGSEYEIEIKNNHCDRIESVCSVDGLDVLTGKTANENNNGYVVDGYHPLRIKGFRYSDEAVGAFKFELKDGSYAAIKGKKSKRNCGVIGVRIFGEKKLPVISIPTVWIQNTPKPDWDGEPHPMFPPKTHPWKPYWGDDHITWCGVDSHGGHTTGGNNNHVFFNMSCNNSPSVGEGLKGHSKCCNESVLRSAPQDKPKGFDMGTAWGSKKESKVTSVKFDRDSLEFSLDIYYASRESLIEMGVPINNHAKISSPKSFPGGYAKPPHGWHG